MMVRFDRDKMKGLCLIALALAFCGCETLEGETPDTETGEQSIWGGELQQDYYHPWTVRFTYPGCGGVLIHPEWVLTAGHCLEPFASPVIGLEVGSTDPHTSEEHYQTALLNEYVVGTKRSIYIHPFYTEHLDGSLENDIALVRVRPVPLNRYIQTAALPDSPLLPGKWGTHVTYVSHDGDLPDGYVKTLDAEVLDGCTDWHTPAAGTVCMRGPTGDSDQGDSGSGIYSMERVGEGFYPWSQEVPTRATVIGLVSYGPSVDPENLGQFGGVVDVYYYKDWILETIANSTGWTPTPQDEFELEGNVNIHVSDVGIGSPGELSVSCTNRWGNHVEASAPMDVPGIGLGLYCAAGEWIDVKCGSQTGGISPHEIDDLTLEIEGDTFVEEGTGSFANMIAKSSSEHWYLDFTCNTDVNMSVSPPDSPPFDLPTMPFWELTTK